MKKGVIVVNAYCNLPSMLNQSLRLKEEFYKLGVEISIIKNDYYFNVNNNCEIDGEFENCDFCIYLDKDKYLGQFLEKKGIKTFNNISSIGVCDDKMQTYLSLIGSKINAPKTISAPLNYVNEEVSFTELEKIANILKFPLVVKLSYSSLGKGVFLVNDINEFYNVVNAHKNDAKIYQEYVSSSFGKDARLICVGKKYLCAMLRKSTTDFRSNAELGGKGYEFIPNSEFIKVAEKVAEILNLDYMGIDLMFGKTGEPILCEVNSNAFFGVMEKVSGVNVAKAYAEYVYNSIYKE